MKKKREREALNKQKRKGTPTKKLAAEAPVAATVIDVSEGEDDGSFEGFDEIDTTEASFREANSLCAKDKEQELEAEEEEALLFMGEHREVEMKSGQKKKQLQFKVRFWFDEEEDGLPEGQDQPGFGKPEWCGDLASLWEDEPKKVRAYVKAHPGIAHYFAKIDKELKAVAQEHKKRQKEATEKKKKEAQERKQVSALCLLNEFAKP